MLLEKGRIITSFKVISVLILAFMFVEFYSVMNIENVNNLKNKNNSQDHQIDYFQQTNFSKFNFINRQNFCEIESNDIISESILFMNNSIYYSFAVFLGAFINAKKIMKIGVI